jgi:hypothetical protein
LQTGSLASQQRLEMNTSLEPYRCTNLLGYTLEETKDYMKYYALKLAANYEEILI